MKKRTHGARSELGIALIVVLISILLLSTLVAGIIFVTQTQVWTSYNYRLTTQARYAAEAGIQRTMNWIVNSYTAPSTFTSYDTTKYPVQSTANSQPVVLSALSGTSSNYPVSTVQTQYNTALSSQSVSGIPNATFSTTATLLRMTPGSVVSWLAAAGAGVPQTWQITSVGSIGAVGNILGNATVQLQATYERTGTPIFGYALETTGTGCGTVNISSSSYIDSFNSSQGTYTATHQASGGNVATNGNMTLSGSAKIQGNFSAPNTNTGACPGNGITSSSSASPIDTGVTTLSKSLSPANPLVPSPTPPTTTQSISGTCGTISGCTKVGTTISLSPSSTYGNLSVSGATTVHLTAGTYNMNSLALSGASQLVLDSTPVILNMAGGTGASSAVNFSGGTISNATGIASNFAILYAGSLPIALSGGTANYGVVYAPNSAINMSGSAPWYGAFVSKSYVSSGGSLLHYDLALNSSMLTMGSFAPINFSWNKF
jgi:Tfp pilus assembly protein PilX